MATAHEPEKTTSQDGEAKTGHEPENATSQDGEAKTGHEPEKETSQDGEAKTGHEPEKETSQDGEAKTGHGPEKETSQDGEAKMSLAKPLSSKERFRQSKERQLLGSYLKCCYSVVIAALANCSVDEKNAVRMIIIICTYVLYSNKIKTHDLTSLFNTKRMRIKKKKKMDFTDLMVFLEPSEVIKPYLDRVNMLFHLCHDHLPVPMLLIPAGFDKTKAKEYIKFAFQCLEKLEVNPELIMERIEKHNKMIKFALPEDKCIGICDFVILVHEHGNKSKALKTLCSRLAARTFNSMNNTKDDDGEFGIKSKEGNGLDLHMAGVGRSRQKTHCFPCEILGAKRYAQKIAPSFFEGLLSLYECLSKNNIPNILARLQYLQFPCPVTFELCKGSSCKHQICRTPVCLADIDKIQNAELKTAFYKELYKIVAKEDYNCWLTSIDYNPNDEFGGENDSAGYGKIIHKYRSFFNECRGCETAKLLSLDEIKTGCTICHVKGCQNNGVPMCNNCRGPEHPGSECIPPNYFLELSPEEQNNINESIENGDLCRCMNPNCGRIVAKDDGCDHIKCRCGEDICFSCGHNIDPGNYVGTHTVAVPVYDEDRNKTTNYLCYGRILLACLDHIKKVSIQQLAGNILFIQAKICEMNDSLNNPSGVVCNCYVEKEKVAKLANSAFTIIGNVFVISGLSDAKTGFMKAAQVILSDRVRKLSQNQVNFLTGFARGVAYLCFPNFELVTSEFFHKDDMDKEIKDRRVMQYKYSPIRLLLSVIYPERDRLNLTKPLEQVIKEDVRINKNKWRIICEFLLNNESGNFYTQIYPKLGEFITMISQLESLK